MWVCLSFILSLCLIYIPLDIHMCLWLRNYVTVCLSYLSLSVRMHLYLLLCWCLYICLRCPVCLYSGCIYHILMVFCLFRLGAFTARVPTITIGRYKIFREDGRKDKRENLRRVGRKEERKQGGEEGRKEARKEGSKEAGGKTERGKIISFLIHWKHYASRNRGHFFL